MERFWSNKCFIFDIFFSIFEDLSKFSFVPADAKTLWLEKRVDWQLWHFSQWETSQAQELQQLKRHVLFMYKYL